MNSDDALPSHLLKLATHSTGNNVPEVHCDARFLSPATGSHGQFTVADMTQR